VADAAAQGGLVVLDRGARQPLPARWAGRLLLLGARLAHHSPRNGWQLVVAISVPVRDYAALFISAGWILSQPHVRPADPLAEAGAIPAGTPVRLATTQQLIADRFYGIDHASGHPSVHVGSSRWKIENIRYIAADPGLSDTRFRRIPIPVPGGLVRKVGRADTWCADHCANRPVVAVIGTRARLEQELDLRVGWAGAEPEYDRLGDVVRPDEGKTPSWWSEIIPGGGEDLPDIPRHAQLAILDGASAIRWLAEIRTPIVVCLIDRGSPDESAPSAVVQRLSIGRPVSVDSLRWGPLPGIEAIAFEAMV
jgi:hypothetical protein